MATREDEWLYQDLADQGGDPSLEGGVVGFVGAVIALLIAFGVNITPDQEAAILRVLVLGLPLLTAWLIRRKAWRPSSVQRRTDAVERAVNEGPLEEL